MEHQDKRAFSRAQFFLLPQETGYVPVFSFRPSNRPDGIAAIVMDIGEGGTQVLTTLNAPVTEDRYMLECTLGADANAQEYPPVEVVRVWTRPEGMYFKTGFTFAHPVEALSALQTLLKHSEHQVLRCVLYPMQN